MNVSVEGIRHAYARKLLHRYPGLQPAEAIQAVEWAYGAVALFQLLDDPDAPALWFTCAERDVRLRLGVEVEEARLDPQRHDGRRVCADAAGRQNLHGTGVHL